MVLSYLDSISFGWAKADGRSHPLRERYRTLADAQLIYPFATNLEEEIDRCALQKCINAARVTYGGDPPAGKLVGISSGVYRLDRTLQVDSVRGLDFAGYGKSVKLEWWGPPDQPVFHLTDCNRCRFRDFDVVQPTGQPFTYGFLLRNGAKGITVPTACLFQDIAVAGGIHCWGIDRGMDAQGQGGGDQNNECHLWNRCACSGYSSSAFRVDAGQAHSLRFTDCEMRGTSGTTGLWCSYGSSVHWQGGTGGGHTDDFLFDDFVLVCSIKGWNSEGSERLCRVHQKGYTGAAANVAFADCRWAGMPSASDTGIIIRVQNPGPLSIRNNLFVSDNDANPMVIIGSLGGVGPVTVEHVGNTYKGKKRYIQSALLLPQSGWDVFDRCNKYLDPAIPGEHDDRWDAWRVDV